jgi:hypothetical protein
MVVDLVRLLLGAGALVIIFIFVGYPILKILTGRRSPALSSGLEGLMTAAILGFSFIVIAFWYAMTIWDQIEIAYSLTIALVLLSWSLAISQNRIPAVLKDFREFLYSLRRTQTLIIIFLANLTSLVAISPFASRSNITLRQRVGPDAIGWSSSGLYFKENNSSTKLREELSDLIHPLSIEYVFDESKFDHGFSPIFKIANFSNQINSEFIIGAERYTGASLLGTIMRIFQLDGANVYPFLMFTMLLFTFLIVAAFFTTRHLVYCLIPTAVVLNPITVTIALEGGGGNLFVLPALSFLSAIVLKVNSSENIASESALKLNLFAIVSAASLMIYFDTIVGLALLLPFFAFKLLEKATLKEFLIGRNAAVAIFTCFVMVSLIFTQVDQFRERAGNRNAGGWSIGDWPTLADMLGLMNWIPASGTVNSPQFRTWFLLVDTVLILILILQMRKVGQSSQIQMRVLFISLVLACVSNLILFVTNENLKTYQIWKVSFFISTIFIIALGLIESENPPFSSSKVPRKFRDKKRAKSSVARAIYGLSALAIVSGATSVADFRSYSNGLPDDLIQFAKSEEFTRLESTFDFVPLGFRSPQLFALLSSDIYFSSRSQGSIWGKEEPREKAYFVLREACSLPDCRKESKGLVAIEGSRSFLVFVRE